MIHSIEASSATCVPAKSTDRMMADRVVRTRGMPKRSWIDVTKNNLKMLNLAK